MRNQTWLWMLGLLVSLALIGSACAAPVASETQAPAQEEMIVDESIEMEGDEDGDMDVSSDVGVVEETVDETPTSTGEGEGQPPQIVELPSDEEMMALLEEKVQGGHSTARVLSASYDYEGWIAVLDRMIGYGAKINLEEKELLAVWLAQRNQ